MRGWTIAAALAATLSTTGCLVEQRYVMPEGAPGPWALAIDENTPAWFDDGDVTLYLVEERILVPFREPTEEEWAALSEIEDGVEIPYARLPFVPRGGIELQIDWTLSNLSDSTVLAAVVANGINEFHEYVPGVTVVDDDALIDFSGWERTLRLEPGERRRGTIREEELDEIAVDLATVVNGAPNPNQVVYFQNHSDHDPRSQMYIPDVIPALTGVRLGIRAENNRPLLLEATVRVRDVDGFLVQGDDEPWMTPQPALFSPADVVVEED